MAARPARVLLLVAVLLSGCGRTLREPVVSLMAPAPPDPGRYLAFHVALCVFCHSEIDWKADGFPPRSDFLGGGRAVVLDTSPGLAAPNLTPDPLTGAGRWTEEQFDQALRRGIGVDGRTLNPLMPYASYHSMTDADASAIVGYLRSLRPVQRGVPLPEIPPDPERRRRPLPPPGGEASFDSAASRLRGEYLATIAVCGHCHTPVDDQGAPIAGLEFAGGRRLKGPWGDLHVPNITPDASGIGGLGEKAFLHLMKTGQLPGRTLSAIMPWGYYRGMKDADLRALYEHLRTLKPVRHFIDNSIAPTPCRTCGRPHGLGERNR